MTDELRDRIARALHRFDTDTDEALANWPWYQRKADAVLGVLSPTDGWEATTAWWCEQKERPVFAHHSCSTPEKHQRLYRRVDGAAPQPEPDALSCPRCEGSGSVPSRCPTCGMRYCPGPWWHGGGSDTRKDAPA
jgi:hypothetical protein